MRKSYFILAAMASVALASCTNEVLVEQGPGTEEEINTAINFGFDFQKYTRAGELVGATAAEKLGGMFVVEGTKGTEADDAPSSTVVFDNYLVGYEYNSAGTTESNTNNWEYVGKQAGITGRMTADTWHALHPAGTSAQSQNIKYWDYTQDQYDFIAWSTGEREAVTDAAVAGSKVKVTRINTGSTLATNGFTMTALSAADLLECYYTDINTVPKANYGAPVTLTFRNMASKVRVALYETVPGYSVKEVKFYEAEATNPTEPADLGTGTVEEATLFTTGTDVLPQSGEVLVYYPRIGKTNRDASSKPVDYNKAHVTVNPATGGATSTTQAFGELDNQYVDKEEHEASGKYLGRNITKATFAGDAADNFYKAVIPNTNGYPLTLRLDYTLVATDGSGEEINVYGAKAVVPSTYTVWQPNYAYTYIFKISDNTNGWTSKTPDVDPAGLFPITFDAVVTNFIDANAEQTTVTTVATPSITTYQQGHDHAHKNEYSKSQLAGADQTNVKDLYVQVMDNNGTPTLKTDLSGTNKSLLYKITKSDADYVASEAEVMDALQNRTNAAPAYSAASPVGRNGITLTANANIANDVDEIVNGVDDQPISINAGEAAKIDMDLLATGTYAYVYATTVPSNEEAIYNLVSATEANAHTDKYYEVAPSTITQNPCGAGAKAGGGKVYFVKNVDAEGNFVSYTFKQTKVGDDVEGLHYASIPADKANTYTAGNFYFDVYNQNNGAYAVKVIKVVN